MNELHVCRLDGAALKSLDDIYDRMAEDLAFLDYFGRNLDALWDVLTGDLPGPVQIELSGAGAARTAMGPKFDAFLEVLQQAAASRDDLTFNLQPE